MTALLCALYLLLRRGNAFQPDVSPPLRLRRWAMSFYFAAVLSHVCWYLFYRFDCQILSVYHIALSLFDSIMLLTTVSGTVLAMLQDRQRSVWPVLAAMVPFVALGVFLMFRPSVQLMYVDIAYFLVVFLLFTVHLLFSVKQYGRWLCDNYADLEHKKIWLSEALTIIIMVVFLFYGLDDGAPTLNGLFVVVELAFFGLLLWRIETIADLQGQQLRPSAADKEVQGEADDEEPAEQPANIDIAQIGRLLAERCEATQLYLRHDLSLLQLAKALHTNRTYLGQYFSSQGTTYNVYINDLRIRHFVSRYREAVHNDPTVTAQQLASDSGYRSYSTFSLAFKQRMGQSVTAWMHDAAEQQQ
jgi:AraC-like DNA-binding protein